MNIKKLQRYEVTFKEGTLTHNFSAYGYNRREAKRQAINYIKTFYGIFTEKIKFKLRRKKNDYYSPSAQY